ncbi:MAG: hypothetical protein LBR43_03215 [Spiroplasmataceae bacterium]|nr:hypothetical protein [Spiroplasmataceae bacterium]
MKYDDGEDNFNGLIRPFVTRKIKENKVHLIPVTSKQKKKVEKAQYLISSPKNPTCLTSDQYPYSYANANRKIVITFSEKKEFSKGDFCKLKCFICLAERKFEGLKNFVNEYWVDRKNSLPENPSKVKKIAVIF